MTSLPRPRGPLSALVISSLRTDPAASAEALPAVDPDGDADLQLALWTLYELHYGGFDGVDDRWEWHPALLALRARLEAAFEAELRARYLPEASGDDLAEEIFALVEAHDGPSLAARVHRTSDVDEVRELLKQRSVYQLKEADPVAWVVPRLPAGPKGALMDLQYDEYGNGDPHAMHSELFARGMESVGLDATYGAYLDEALTETLALNNALSLFGFHRRLRGAAMGHLAAFEATSSLPSRRTAQGLERLGLPDEVRRYYTEHVEADAVHEQLATRLICAPLVEQEPHLRDDVMFGAFTCVDLEARFATALLDRWGEPRLQAVERRIA